MFGFADSVMATLRVEKVERVQKVEADLTVQSFIQRDQNERVARQASATATTTAVVEDNPIDIDSKKGRFGWETFDNNIYIPYIFRFTNEKFVATKAAEEVCTTTTMTLFETTPLAQHLIAPPST